MSRFIVSILPRAELDLATVSEWLHNHSPQGAANWLSAFGRTVEQLTLNPAIFGSAPESVPLERTIKQAIFKTRRGKNYRIVFVVEGSKVFILRVRGPGEPLLQADEL